MTQNTDHLALAPLTWSEVQAEWYSTDKAKTDSKLAAYDAGVRFAERHHGIRAAPSGVPQASKPQEGDDLAAARGEAPAAPMDELRRAAAVIAVVGQIDGYDVIRRESVLDIIDRRLP